ncbi:MAG: pyridoxal-dependent decarboxylase [Gemmatimonadaceae bacterium]
MSAGDRRAALSRAEVSAMLAADASGDTATRMIDLAVEWLAHAASGEGAVSRNTPPAEIAARFDEPLPEHGVPLDDILRRLREQVMSDANRLSHPMYMGHQVSAPLPIAAWTDALAAVMNNGMAVREMSPTLTHVEQRVVRWMCNVTGFGPGSGGTFTSGGSEATLTALLAARAKVLPAAWEEGVAAGTPVVICGEHAHYAVRRAVGIIGLGVRQVVTVPSVDYRMDAKALPAILARLHAEARPVVAVVASAGHTATGSFDNLERIADACAPSATWLHVDAAHGASALLSERHRVRLRGIERVDSLAWDPHKMMLMPLAAGMLLVRDEVGLERAFSQQAPYLFHRRDDEPSYDIGPRSFLCSRRADALKVWVALQRYGREGIAVLYDYLVELTEGLHDRLVAHPRFEPLHAPETNILCFRYLGDESVGEQQLDALNRALRGRYNHSGEGWITLTELDGRQALRVTIINPRTTPAHLDRLVEGLDSVGEGLVQQPG